MSSSIGTESIEVHFFADPRTGAIDLKLYDIGPYNPLMGADPAEATYSICFASRQALSLLQNFEKILTIISRPPLPVNWHTPLDKEDQIQRERFLGERARVMEVLRRLRDRQYQLVFGLRLRSGQRCLKSEQALDRLWDALEDDLVAAGPTSPFPENFLESMMLSRMCSLIAGWFESTSSNFPLQAIDDLKDTFAPPDQGERRRFASAIRPRPLLAGRAAAGES